MESNLLPGNDPSPTGTGRPGCSTYALLIAASAWILLVTVVLQGPTWVVDNVQMSSASGLGGWVWVLVSWGQAVLMLIVLVPLALATRWRRLRSVYQTWAVAALCSSLLACARFFSLLETQYSVAALAVLALIAAGLLFVATRIGKRSLPVGARLLPASLVLAGAISLPSLVWGALGSPLDALLGLAAGLAFGLLAGLLLGGWLFGPVAAGETGTTARAWLGGRDRALAVFGAGTTLFILGSAFGVRGSQFLMLIALPPLGIALTAMEAARELQEFEREHGITMRGGGGGAWLPVLSLVGIVAAALTMFWDPSELSLLLGPADILGWALRAAEVTLAIAAVLGLLAWVIVSPRARQVGTRLSASKAAGEARVSRIGIRGWTLAALAVWAVAGLAYMTLGHPGFYGEEFFVILRDQANVVPAYQIQDRTTRLHYVYTTLAQHAEQSQASLRQELDARGIAYQSYYLVNGLQVNGGPLLRAYLTGRPEVDRIVNSVRLRPLPSLPEAPRGDASAPTAPQWNITNIGADRVWNELGINGQGIVVGQSDSGVQGDHPALVNSYRGRDDQNDYNWLDPWYNTSRPTDLSGHGTHTLGSVMGREGIGVAPGAQWIACVNLARNLGNPAWYLNCLQFMLAPYPQGGDAFHDGDPARAAHVLNNSWGCPPLEGCDANTLAAATSALRAAGIFVVASAGNGGPGCSTVSDPIALYGDVFSVGAVDQGGELADFSSRGPVTIDGSKRTKPDIVAPGVDVLSAYPGGTYAQESGTSMAGPHVTGVVALMWSAQPKLIGDIDRTTQILMETARPYTGPLDGCSQDGVPNDDVGYGVVDAYAAVQAALAIK